MPMPMLTQSPLSLNFLISVKDGSMAHGLPSTTSSNIVGEYLNPRITVGKNYGFISTCSTRKSWNMCPSSPCPFSSLPCISWLSNSPKPLSKTTSSSPMEFPRMSWITSRYLALSSLSNRWSAVLSSYSILSISAGLPCLSIGLWLWGNKTIHLSVHSIPYHHGLVSLVFCLQF
jgi:hypothetical protein